ncbi:type IX secretion system plug protein [Aquimarina agarilytica]|uniref:type IX secretion system plug protein n=1 Tax=Aquimarina agarilytica TaxID=1087449 RepID=UPI000287F4EA|nr:DUF5103 domain-containing protein [Aquimarina agarilytica]
MYSKSLSFLFTLLSFFYMLSQEATEVAPPEYIKTIQFVQNGENKNGTPLIELGTRFEINFDDIIGDEAFYYYKISYYNFDWTPTILSKNEYLDGIDNILLQDTENSLNSLQIYTHYKMQIPNSSTRALKKSGNYIFELYNDNEELVFSKKFIVYQKGATIQANVKRSRDFNFLNKKQVVQFSINSNELIVNPKKNLKTLILQNNNLKTAITNLKSQYTIGNKFIYRYDKETSFWGGNEYWNFDNKDVRNATVNISHIELKDIYHNYLYAHSNRSNQVYTFFPDVNGNFVVRNIDAQNSDIEAEYVWLHFKLKTANVGNKEIHLYGNFNNFTTDQSTLLTYNKEERAYIGKRLFKQGFYNFKYVTKDKNGIIDENAICGNFDKTENEYIIIAYYRAPNSRNDSIIGIGSTNSANITN